MSNKLLGRALKIAGGLVAVLVVGLLIYFPGRQTIMAFTLATGIGVSGLQERVDLLEEKAIAGASFSEDETRFLSDLYLCFAKGGRLTVVLRQSSDMMFRYLSCSGEDLKTEPRIFVGSKPVREQLAQLRERIRADEASAERLKESYESPVFYMGDPKFFDSFVGLYYGRVIAAPKKSKDGRRYIQWRAECPWEWPSYDDMFEKYGKHHAQTFALPNLLGIIGGRDYCLQLDDGLGGQLAELGIAKSFLVYAEWTEEIP